MTTIREHLERALGRAERDGHGPIRKDVAAALAILDDSDVQNATDNANADRCRLIPDPSRSA